MIERSGGDETPGFFRRREPRIRAASARQRHAVRRVSGNRIPDLCLFKRGVYDGMRVADGLLRETPRKQA